MKKVIAFKQGDEIPTNAVYLGMGREIETTESVIPGTHNVTQSKSFSVPIFYYEVKDHVSRESGQESYKPKIVEIINYLNEQAGTKFSPETEATQKLIKKWLKIGKNVDDFKTAIDNKVSDWLNDLEMCKYLRPSTLFGPKFESYISHGVPSESDAFDDLEKYMKPELNN